MSLPEDWWGHPYGAIDFANIYQRHTLGLSLAVKSEKGYQHEMLSGCKFYHRDCILWVTAGHTIKYLDRVLQEYGNQVTMMAWCDYFGSSEAGYVPVSHRDFRKFYVYEPDKDGTDIGFGILEGLDEKNIRENLRGVLLTAPSSDAYAGIEPEGFHLVGYPGEFGKLTSASYNESKDQITSEHRLVCLPIEKQERPLEEQPSNDFWRFPNAFYGRILRFSEDWLSQPSDISGMSGGPIFAVTRSPERRFQYYLVGIQGSWLSGSRYIRAEPIMSAFEFIDRTLNAEGLL